MKFGVKSYSDESFLKKFEEDADFFEIMAVKGRDYEFVKNLKKPVVVHAMHSVFGINLADESLEEKNIEAINFAKQTADKAKSNKIIIHAGFFSNNAELKNSINFIKKHFDPRFLVENCPKKVGKEHIGSLEDMKKIIEKTGVGFCLDINHAIVTANFLGEDYKEYLKEFLKLNPGHYHLGGQTSMDRDTHSSFKESKLDLELIFKMLPKDAEITLETETNTDKTKEDLIIAEKLEKLK